MRWVKRIEPIILSQESDVPYVIQTDGVLLCFDNIYREGSGPTLRTDFQILFKASHQQLMRQSTQFFKFKNFPITIPFENVISLNETIIDGKLVKFASEQNNDAKSIAIVNEKFIGKLGERKFQEFAEELDTYDNSFILTGEDINTNTRLLCDTSNTIHHIDWGRTCVAVSDMMCNTSLRKFCWTKQVPIMEITTYGLNANNVEKLYQNFINIGVEVTTNWGG
jgi:hypothetical protein